MFYWCVKYFVFGSQGERFLWADTATAAQDAVIKEFRNCNIISCERINTR